MDIKVTSMNGQSYVLPVQSDTTVASLKILIAHRFQLAPGVAVERLLYDDQHSGQRIALDDPSRSLGSYEMPPHANISVLFTPPASIQVFLRTEKGQTHTYTVAPGETVAAFKLMVREREGVIEDQQRLIHEGQQMDDGGRTLESYHVKEGSTVYLTGRLRGG
ncbi:hypothetical protein NHX12_028671 [Muraenolepis orangiensis]|uniref:Ubiquitin-like domain-containing protein n=1 Tax=Muraenolepis orangiensis TaxID=630683 RepID=A0A9Q0EB11_9TELE|nr:hypothetical protein NHX12_028671 [Muraenolepis orangiensis]